MLVTECIRGLQIFGALVYVKSIVLGSLRQLELKAEGACARGCARIAEGFPELYSNLFRPQLRSSKLKEKIKLKFTVTLQFSSSESIRQLNNRSTQILFFLDIIVGANGTQRLSASSVVSLSLSLFMVFRKMSNL